MSNITNAAIEAENMTEEIKKIEPATITIDEVENYDLPSTYEEGTPPPAPFRIADDDVADWAIKKIAEKKAEYDRLKDLADREIERITMKVEQAKRRYEADSAFLTGRLADYFQTVPHKKTKTTEKYQLLSGTLTMKLGGTDYKRDDAKLIAWLKENGHEDMIRVKEEPAWGDLKKQIEAVGSSVFITATGEILEGIEATQAPDIFKVDI